MATATEAPASTTAEGLTSHTQNQLEALVSRAEQMLAHAETGWHGYSRADQVAALHKLREPFDLREVRYKPQPWCKKCSAQKSWPKVCEHHAEIKCQRCNGQKVTEAHICLKYIGHAEATNRLLNVDPFWNWEPLALDQAGLPQYDGNRAMWIKLTVCGITRIGYGDAQGKDGANAVKEIIGDAIRNAAMRFGMALNLWTSSDLQILEPGVELTPELAAELGRPADTPPTAPRPRPAEQKPATEAAKPMTPEETQHLALEAFKPKVTRGWNSLVAMEQSLAEARAKSLLNEVVPAGADEVPIRIEDLLTNRIAELKAALAGGGERSAA